MMNRMKILIAILVVLALGRTVGATVMMKMSVSNLSTESDIVAVGRIVDVRMVVVKGQPWTTGTVVVEKTVKGHAQGNLYFRIPGGMQQINGRTLVTRVEGTPDLTSMQRAVFFLHGQAPQYMDLVGWSQGYWPIKNMNGQEVTAPYSDAVESGMPLERLIRDIERVSRTKQQ